MIMKDKDQTTMNLKKVNHHQGRGRYNPQESESQSEKEKVEGERTGEGRGERGSYQGQLELVKPQTMKMKKENSTIPTAA